LTQAAQSEHIGLRDDVIVGKMQVGPDLEGQVRVGKVHLLPGGPARQQQQRAHCQRRPPS